MSTDAQTNFIAEGPAPVGFRTVATGIGKGVDVVGTELGVRGAGPTGVHGQGNLVGVKGIGLARGRGGEFSSALASPQLKLVPHHVEPTSLSAATGEFATPILPLNPREQLPARGQVGDLWAAEHRSPSDVELAPCSLWLCIRPSSGSARARWAQVLLGHAFEGLNTSTP